MTTTDATARPLPPESPADLDGHPAPELGLAFTPAPGSPWRAVPDPAPTVPITILEAQRKPLCKVWKQRRDGGWPDKPTASAAESLFRRSVATVPHGDIEALYRLVRQTAQHPRRCFVYGQPVDDGRLNDFTPRRKHARGNQAATLVEVPTSLLWLDVDNFTLPDADVVQLPEVAVAAVVDALGADFADASYVWWFSGSQKPTGDAIKLRLGFFLETPATLGGLKRWAKTAAFSIDPTLYQAHQIIYVANPQFSDATGAPLRDWLPMRCGYIQGDRDAVSIAIPPEPERRTATPPLSGTGSRCPEVLRPLVAMIERATANGDPRHPAIYNAAYTAGGYVAGGAVALAEARAALLPVALASGSDRAFEAVEDALEAGQRAPLYAPNPIDALEAVYPVPKYQRYSPQGANAKIRRLIDDVLANPLDADGKPRRVVIRAPAGLGKTHIGIEALMAASARALWFAPTHALAEETADRFKAAGAGDGAGNLVRFMPDFARAMRGRGAKDPSDETGTQVLCKKPESLKAIKAAGLNRHTKSLLCKAGRGGGEVCDVLAAGRCGYFNQMRSTAHVRVLAHNYLSIHQAEVLGDFPDTAALAVIDESPLDALVAGGMWTDDPERSDGRIPLGRWFADADLAAVAGEVLHGTRIPDEQRATVLAAIQAGLDAAEEVPAVSPLMSDAEAATAIAGWTGADAVALLPLRLAAVRYLEGETNTLWRGESGGWPALFTRSAKALPTIEKLPAIFLDATANPEIYRALLGERIEFHGFEVAMHGVRVTQVTDSTMYRRKIDPTAAGADAATDKMVMRLAGWATLNPRAGMVTHTGTLDAVMQIQPDVRAAWFGALRGVDTLRDVPALLVAGRPEPNARDVEATARALWPRETLTLTGAYEMRRGGYEMANGDRVPVAVRSHADPRCAAVLSSIREETLIQAIGRGRYIHGGTGRRLVVATSVPIPGLIVDRLATLDEVLPEARLSAALVAGGGVVPLSAGWLAERCPESFRNPQAAKDWLLGFSNPQSRATEFSKVSCRDKDLYPGNSPLKTVEYRVDGQRGGKMRKAVTIHSRAETATRLAGLLGKAITLKPLGDIEAVYGGPFIPWPDFALRWYEQIEDYENDPATVAEIWEGHTPPIVLEGCHA